MRRKTHAWLGVLLSVVAVAAAGPSTAAAGDHTNGAGLTIPGSGPATPYPSTITVAGEQTSLTGLTVTLTGLSHVFPDDVMVVLQGPGGQAVRLMSDRGGNRAHGVADVNLTFDDAAAGPPADHGPLVSGTFQPSDGTRDPNDPGENEAPADLPAPGPAGPYGLSLLGAFGGTNPNGEWRLWVLDDTAVDDGSLDGWTLHIASGQPPGTPDMTAATDSGVSDADNVTKDPSPQFTGSSGGASAGQLKIYADPNTPGDAADDILLDTPNVSGGTYTSDNNTALADGSYQVYTRNTAENLESGRLTVVIDTQAPGTTTPDLVAGDDTGPSSSDNITSDSTPTFTGSTTNGENGDTTLVVNEVNGASEAGPTNSGYTLSQAMAPGIHEVRAFSTDLAGNHGPLSGTLTVEITGPGCDFAVTRTGTSGADSFEDDSSARNRWRMLGGDDFANSGHGSDCVQGGAGNDELVGEDGRDRLEGDGGHDRLIGGDGADWLIGGAGDDFIDAGEGVDVISGGSGNDRIVSRDGRAETVECGTGFDRVYADRQDTLIDCEGRLGADSDD